jgi:hypothetical protein
MPGSVPPVADEREALLAYVAQQRYVIRLAAYGLTDDQARATPLAGPLSVGGLIKHAAAMESGWIDIVLERDQSSQEDYEANFRLLPGETMADVLARYDEVAANTAAGSPGLPTSGRPCPSRAACRGSPTMWRPGRFAGCSSTSWRRPRATRVMPTSSARRSTARPRSR